MSLPSLPMPTFVLDLVLTLGLALLLDIDLRTFCSFGFSKTAG
jgi:hypothetical protein